MLPLLLAIGAGILSGVLVGELAASASEPGGEGSSKDITPGGDLLPAFPNLLKLTPADRQAYIDACKALGINPYEMAKVIQSESTWRTDVPVKAEGTPRGGFFQLTVGGGVDEFNTKEKVWAFRDLSFQEQLQRGFIPYYADIQKRWNHPPDAKAIEWYKGIFLPAATRFPNDKPIAELGNMSKIGNLTLDSIYQANPAFHVPGRDYFTWNDVARHVDAVLAAAKGRLVDAAGTLYDAATQQPIPKAPSGDVGAVLTAAATLAPALHVLLSQINNAWPKRSKLNDDMTPKEAGQEMTDHGRGIALDIGHDLKNGPGLGKLADWLLTDPRVDYVIWDNHVMSPGGKWEPYCEEGETSCNPHRRHLHVSILDTAEVRDNTSAWILSDLTPEQISLGVASSGAASAARSV